MLGVTATTAHSPDPYLAGALFAQNQDVRFRWRAGEAPPAAMQAAIKAAAADANRSRLSRAATFTSDAAGASWINYGLNVGCGVNGLACFSRVNAPNSFTMSFREQGHIFDWGVLHWCQMTVNQPNGCYDAENIALDEFGHVEILNHHVNFGDDHDYLDAVVQTYSHIKPLVGWNAHAFGRCDVATLQRKYDLPLMTTAYSTCLDLATSAGITAELDPRRLQLERHVDCRAQRRRPRRIRTPWRQSRLGTGRHPATAGARRRLDQLRDDARRGIRWDVHLHRHDAEGDRRLAGGVLEARRRRAARHSLRERPRLRRALPDRLPGIRFGVCPVSATGAGSFGLAIFLLVAMAACAAPAVSPAASPAAIPSPTAASSPSAVVSPSSSTAEPQPPAAVLSIAAGPPVAGSLGSYTFRGTGSDSPWLPGTPIAVPATGGAARVLLDPPVGIASWRARRAPPGDTTGAATTAIASGSGPIAFNLDGRAGTLVVLVEFADNQGSAAWFWRLSSN